MDTLYKNTGQVNICEMNARMSYDLAHATNSCESSDFNNFNLTLIYHRCVRQKVDFEVGKTFG
jgi:hypothetical protein